MIDAAKPFEQETTSQLHHSERVVHGLYVLALLGHILFFAMSVALQIMPLLWFNIVSCGIYAGGFLLIRRKLITAALLIGVVEVTAHAWFATGLLGFASGFHIYALALIPFVMFYDKWSMTRRSIGTLMCIVSYAALAYWGQTVIPNSSEAYVSWMHMGNIIIGSLVLGLFSFYYGRAVLLAETLLLAQNVQLETLTRTDPLTQLPNRRYAREWLTRELARSKRGKKVFCICLADLDNFKIVNDNYGHDAGDAILQHVSETISSTLRQQDVVARWGGEEFLIILPETDIDGGKIAVEKVRSDIERASYLWNEVDISITITIGVAEHDLNASVDTTIQKADKALYSGKSLGRNRVVVAN